MTPNQRELKKLRDKGEPRLAVIPATTLRSHIEGRAPRSLDHLVLYEDLGLPLKGWKTPAELRCLGVKPLEKV
jgi:hypothetical protein